MPEPSRGSADALVLERISRAVVGLRRETEVLAVAMGAGRHVLMEGPPGSGKSTLLGRLAAETGRAIQFVEGNAELTPGRLVGQFDPALVLEQGYRAEFFLDGPLVAALRSGSWLYVEEFNRIPEETLNVLLTVLAEGELHVPRLGRIVAEPGFWLVSAMNPFDAVGTARISQAVADRMCRIAVGYQDETAERRIAERVTGSSGAIVEIAVAVARGTRTDARLRSGSSVRGAIDMTLLAVGLAELRGVPSLERGVLVDAALAALTGRITLVEGGELTAEDVVVEILDAVLRDRGDDDPDTPSDDGDGDDNGGDDTEDRPAPRGAGPGARPADAHPGPPASQPAPPPLRPSLRGRRTVARRELEARHPDLDDVAPEGGGVVDVAFERLLGGDPDRALPLLADLTRATDPRLRAEAERLSARVFVGAARNGIPARRAVRRLVARRGGEGDVDLERTLEHAGRRPRDREQIVTQDWRGAHRHLTLLVDHSGSMSGDALACAALAAAVVSLAAEGDGDCCIIGFSDVPRTLFDGARDGRAAVAVERVLALEGHGRTNVAAALRAAARVAADGRPGTRDTLVLSDCVSTVGDDPVAALAGVGRLHVLNPSVEPEAVRAGRRLARCGNGWFEDVSEASRLGPALCRVLAVS